MRLSVSRSDRRLGGHVQLAAVAVAGHRLEAARARQVRGVQRRVLRVLRRAQDRVTHRRAQQQAVGVEVQQVRPELLAHPERAVVHARDRLDVEVGAGQQAAGRDGRIDRNLRGRRRIVVGAVVDGTVGDVGGVEQSDGIAERREAVHGHRAARGRAVARRLEVRRHLVEADHEVGAVALRAEAVVRQGDEACRGAATESCRRSPESAARRTAASRR